MGIVEVRRRVGRIITRLYQPLHRQIRRFAKVGGIEGLRPNRMRESGRTAPGKGVNARCRNVCFADRQTIGQIGPHAGSSTTYHSTPAIRERLTAPVLAFEDRGGTRGFERGSALLPRFARPQNCLGLLVVTARQRVPPHDRQFLQHLQTVPQIAHPAALIVRPAHRHLDHTESPLDGNKQNFGVKSPALDGLQAGKPSAPPTA